MYSYEALLHLFNYLETTSSCSNKRINAPIDPIIFKVVIQQVKVVEIKIHTANDVNNVLS